MSKKIFISYKYADTQVQSLNNLGFQGILNRTKVRDYVTENQDLLIDDHIKRLSHISDFFISELYSVADT